MERNSVQGAGLLGFLAKSRVKGIFGEEHGPGSRALRIPGDEQGPGSWVRSISDEEQDENHGPGS